MEVRGPVLAVSCSSTHSIVANILTSSPADIALTEAAYTVVRLFLQFPTIRLPAGQKVEIIGTEKQTMTLVLSSTEGCLVDLGSREE